MKVARSRPKTPTARFELLRPKDSLMLRIHRLEAIRTAAGAVRGSRFRRRPRTETDSCWSWLFFSGYGFWFLDGAAEPSI